METNKIQVQFSSSVDTNGNLKTYEVVMGSTFTDCFNEELDSATIVLDHISATDRLIEIKPYDFVRVFVTNQSGTQLSNRIYLVDSYSEIETNIEQHLFSYTISLFSETKLLEKIQCPNVTVTHNLNDGTMTRKTIYELICQYVELYSPKIKVATNNNTTWAYERLIKVPNAQSDFAAKFSVTSSDLSFAAPTLRQLITTLMQQVSCIPVLKNRTLGYMDFNTQTAQFGNGDYTVSNTVNKIQKSLSSDSFANTLVSLNSNVLDSENEVITEVLGFRDRNNVLLKQTQNLQLETKFPIYKVNKFTINNLGLVCSGYETPKTSWQNNWNLPTQYFDTSLTSKLKFETYIRFSQNDSDEYESAKIVIKNIFDFYEEFITRTFKNGQTITYEGESYTALNVIFENLKFHIFSKDNSVLARNKKVNYEVLEINKDNNSLGENPGTNLSLSFNFKNNQNEIVFDVSDVFDSKMEEIFEHQTDYGIWVEADAFIALSKNNDSIVVKYPAWNQSDSHFYIVGDQYPVGFGDYISNCVLNCAIDISELILEQSQRGALNHNFLEFANGNITTIEQLSKHVFGTVGYTIGSKTISGFSSQYYIGEATIHGWISKDYTYIETICSFLFKNFSSVKKEILSLVYNIPYYPAVPDGPYTDYEIANFAQNFSYLLFGIEYQPLNTFNMKFTKSKEDVLFPIEQYNSSASGVTDFDRLVSNEQEQVDRIGNDTLSISQRTDNFAQIQGGTGNNPFVPLTFRDNASRGVPVEKQTDYTIFKRTYAVGDYCYNVSYTGSKDYILKNYFTSIRTKYRAYQYVDYNSSTIRKENDTVFVCISEGETYFNGDNKIRFGNFVSGTNQNVEMSKLISGAVYTGDEEKLKSIYQKANNEDFAYRNDVSVIVNEKNLAFVYENFDNVSPGLYLDYAGEEIGGVAQGWYIYSEQSNNYPQLLYTYFTASINEDFISEFKDIRLNIEQSAHLLPKDNFISNTTLSTYDDKFVAFTVCDNNSETLQNLKRTMYKDPSEILNHTVQFIYYSESENIKWTELFISNSGFVNKRENNTSAIFGTNSFTLIEKEHSIPAEDTLLYSHYSKYLTKMFGQMQITATAENEFSVTKTIDISDVSSLLDFKIIEKELIFIKDHSSNPSRLLSFSFTRNSETSLSVSAIVTAPRIDDVEHVDFGFYYSYTYIGPAQTNTFVKLINNVANKNPYIEVTWGEYNYLKICHLEEKLQGQKSVKDVIIFKRPNSTDTTTKFYMSLNDTKTDWVLAESNGILYKRYKISRGTLSRTVTDPYASVIGGGSTTPEDGPDTPYVPDTPIVSS